MDAEGQGHLRLMEHTFGSAGGLYDESKKCDNLGLISLLTE